MSTAPHPLDPLPPLTLDALSIRETQIAYRLAKGETNREIATALGLSIKTVDTHRGHIMKKLGTRNNVALVYYMLRAGLVTL